MGMPRRRVEPEGMLRRREGVCLGETKESSQEVVCQSLDYHARGTRGPQRGSFWLPPDPLTWFMAASVWMYPVLALRT